MERVGVGVGESNTQMTVVSVLEGKETSETKCHKRNPFNIVQWFILFKFTPSTILHSTKISSGYRANALFVADFSSFNLRMTVHDSDTTF